MEATRTSILTDAPRDDAIGLVSTSDQEEWESEAERKVSWVQCAEIIWVWKRLQIAKFGILRQAHSLSSPP